MAGPFVDLDTELEVLNNVVTFAPRAKRERFGIDLAVSQYAEQVAAEEDERRIIEAHAEHNPRGW